jgi:hypothetical protein
MRLTYAEHKFLTKMAIGEATYYVPESVQKKGLRMGLITRPTETVPYYISGMTGTLGGSTARTTWVRTPEPIPPYEPPEMKTAGAFWPWTVEGHWYEVETSAVTGYRKMFATAMGSNPRREEMRELLNHFPEITSMSRLASVRSALQLVMQGDDAPPSNTESMARLLDTAFGILITCNILCVEPVFKEGKCVRMDPIPKDEQLARLHHLQAHRPSIRDQYYQYYQYRDES